MAAHMHEAPSTVNSTIRIGCEISESLQRKKGVVPIKRARQASRAKAGFLGIQRAERRASRAWSSGTGICPLARL